MDGPKCVTQIRIDRPVPGGTCRPRDIVLRVATWPLDPASQQHGARRAGGRGSQPPHVLCVGSERHRREPARPSVRRRHAESGLGGRYDVLVDLGWTGIPGGDSGPVQSLYRGLGGGPPPRRKICPKSACKGAGGSSAEHRPSLPLGPWWRVHRYGVRKRSCARGCNEQPLSARRMLRQRACREPGIQASG